MEGISKGDALGDVEAQSEQAHRRAAKAAVWAQDMEQLVGRGTAMRGGVSVEVDLGGTVVGLGISDAAAARGGRAVAAGILTAHRDAQEQLRLRAQESSADAWGAESATTRAVRDEVDRLTPAAGRTEPGPGQPRQDGAW